VLIVFFQIRSQRHLLRTASQARAANRASSASEASAAKDEDAPAAS
jgi:hypothetical protein